MLLDSVAGRKVFAARSHFPGKQKILAGESIMELPEGVRLDGVVVASRITPAVKILLKIVFGVLGLIAILAVAVLINVPA
ncbi:MAG TPA: hypothetical protein VGM68_07210 [Rhizomicrobium sp.]